MKKEHSYNALKVLQIIRALLLIIMSIMVISTAIIGHCASDQNYFPMEQNKNGNIPDNILNYISNNFNNDYYYVCYYEKKEQNDFRPGTYYYYFRLIGYNKNHGENPLFCEINNDLIHFSVYANTQNGLLFRRLSFYDGTSNNITVANNGDLSVFQNLVSSNYSTTKDYVSNFTVYTNNTSTRKVVLLADGVEYIPENDSATQDMEKPQIDAYIPDWTNIPTFDNSSVENALESVYNGVVWLGSNIKGTITGTGEYIADTVRWSIQKVINTIRDVFSGIQDKINEIKTTLLTVVDKIQATFDYISQPLQINDVVFAMQSTDIHTDIVSVVNLSNTAFGIFGTVSEPQNFTIPLDLTGISILHQTQPFYIDLSWIFNARQYIRAFMWCIVTFGLLYSIVIAIPSMLNDSK